MVSNGRYLLFLSRNHYRTYIYQTAVMDAPSIQGPFANMRPVITTDTGPTPTCP